MLLFVSVCYLCHFHHDESVNESLDRKTKDERRPSTCLQISYDPFWILS